MLWKFIKHLAKRLVENVVAAFDVGFSFIGIALIIVLALLPIACLLGTAPKWILWFELIGILAFILVRKYKKFKKENK